MRGTPARDDDLVLGPLVRMKRFEISKDLDMPRMFGEGDEVSSGCRSEYWVSVLAFL